MKISEIDVNFKAKNITEPDIVWVDASTLNFGLHGVYYSSADGMFLRMPRELGKSISNNMWHLSMNTAGGRLRFNTNSPYVAIRAEVPTTELLPHMTMVGVFGFSLMVNGTFVSKITPTQEDYDSAVDGIFSFEGIYRMQGDKENKCEYFFPLYNGVNKLYIGIKKGCEISPATDYTYKTPVLFYGSSITQGGCCSRPGNDYVSLISRWLDTDIINLGFSGNGKAENVMIDYMANIDTSIYVMDYDYNAPNPEFLKATHLNLYKRLRSQKPDTPIVFISKPDFEYDSQSAERREIIKKTYRYAKRKGDKKVYFIDGESLFGKTTRDLCTVDTCHPNDLGFFRMAEKIAPVIDKILKTL